MEDRYDVANPPEPEEWLAMDEGERIFLVEDAHRRTRAPVGQSATAHASMHVVVENRLAEGHVAVVAAYDRFRAAGLDRHTTVHALASVVSRHLLVLLQHDKSFNQETADDDFSALDPAAWKPKPSRR